MKFIILTVICSIITISSPEKSLSYFQTKSDSEGIYLTINDIRNKTGVLQIGVFDSEKGYPDKPVFSFTLAKDTISSGKLRLFIPLKNHCNIGITVLDDENCNKKMDFVFLIKPREGFGFSNNPVVPGRKPPPFGETRIEYTGGRLKLNINMKYV